MELEFKLGKAASLIDWGDKNGANDGSVMTVRQCDLRTDGGSTSYDLIAERVQIVDRPKILFYRGRGSHSLGGSFPFPLRPRLS